MDNVFVIGDVHGNLNRLEALLKQEGLLGRCDDCDGSGLIPAVDINNMYLRELVQTEENCDICDGDGWERKRRDVTVIQLGDLGHFGIDGSPTGDVLCYKYVTVNQWCDIVLWGNHDRALVDNAHAFTGFTGAKANYEVGHYIKLLYEQGRMQLAAEAHGFLITHAGLAAAFKSQNVPDELKTNLTTFVDWINDEDEKFLETQICDKNAWGIRDAISSRRGGMSSVGGILWRDIEENLYPGFRQIFGHSADHKGRQPRIVWKGGNRRIDKDGPFRDDCSYCIDIGGKAAHGEAGSCLAGIWLPSEKIVRVDL